MNSLHPSARELLRGPLLEAGPFPLVLSVVLCDLRPRFIAKGQAGRGYRAVARNGRVLLASDLPLAELPGRCARLRLQTWHRPVLPGEAPRPYGLLLCVRSEPPGPEPEYALRLTAVRGRQGVPAELTLDVGGGMELEFQRRVGRGEC